MLEQEDDSLMDEEDFDFRSPRSKEKKGDSGTYSNFFKVPKFRGSDHFF